MPVTRSQRQSKAHSRGKHYKQANIVPEPFQHDSLEDDSAYIRLLKVPPFGPAGLKRSFLLSTWPIEGAPGYNAISYTWGEETITTTILVNGFPLNVRQTCYDALIQAHSFDGDALLWIDAVCINQNNNVEKACQIKRMFDIYRNAEKVIACVGESNADSTWLFAACRSLAGLSSSSNLDVNSINAEKRMIYRLAEHHSTSSDEQPVFLARLRQTYAEFGYRKYWNRTWIIPEIWAGGEEVTLLCGSDALKLNELRDMDSILNSPNPGERTEHETPLTHLFFVLLYTRTTRGYLGDLLDLTIRTDCQDPRDRIYSLLALIDWEFNGMEPTSPDYTITAQELARKLSISWDDSGNRRILRALRIDYTSLEMRALVAESTLAPSRAEL